MSSSRLLNLDFRLSAQCPALSARLPALSARLSALNSRRPTLGSQPSTLDSQRPAPRPQPSALALSLFQANLPAPSALLRFNGKRSDNFSQYLTETS